MIANPRFYSPHGQVAGTLKFLDKISGSLEMEFLELLRNCIFNYVNNSGRDLF